MARFDPAIKTAKSLIRKNGEIVSWVSIAGEQDASKPWLIVDQEDTPHDVEMCFVPVDKGDTLQFEAKGELSAGYYKGLMGAVGFAPKLSDVVIRNGETLRPEAIDVLAPNGQVILYTVIFKR